MERGPDVRGDVLQVIPRHAPGGPDGVLGTGSVSVRLQLPPARRRGLTRIVVATLSACGLILVAAAVTHVARPSSDPSAYAATGNAPAVTAAAPVAAPPAPAAPAASPAATADLAPQTGTLHLAKPSLTGKVWLDGQKLTTATATVTCGKHQLKVGAHGKPRTLDVPCGGDVKVAR
jgi:hypothetical protein